MAAGAIVEAGMEVYLVPVGDERYELDCEVPDEPETPPEPECPVGFVAPECGGACPRCSPKPNASAATARRCRPTPGGSPAPTPA